MTDTNINLTRVFQIVMILAGLVVLIQGMMLAKVIMIPCMLAVVLAIMLIGPSHWLKSKGVPGWLATTLILSVFILGCLFMVVLLEKSIQGFTQNIPEYNEKLEGIAGKIVSFTESKGMHLGNKKLGGLLDPQAAMKFTGSFLSELSSVAANGFLVILTVMFILAESAGFAAKVARIPGDAQKRLRTMNAFTSSVQQYLLIKTMMSLLTGALVATSLVVLGVDYPVLWGVLAFGFNFVPTIGSIIAAIPAVLLALVQLSPLGVVMAVICYLVINIVVGNFIEPRYMGKKLGLSTLVVFLSLIFWGWVLGPAGMLLSVILTMKVKIALDSNDETAWLGMLLGPNFDETGLADTDCVKG
jgi:AI-2 transport protein TqsA